MKHYVTHSHTQGFKLYPANYEQVRKLPKLLARVRSGGKERELTIHEYEVVRPLNPGT